MNKNTILLSQTIGKNLVTALTQKDMPILQSGDVLIESAYSSINYKDALGVTGRGRIFKKDPIVGGIDVSGTIVKSQSKRFKIGDPVLITGCGLGETHDGGYAQFVCENEANVVHLPKGMDLRQAMIYGTAGFTAALCLERMEMNGQKPDMGPIMVTGASGGVGQFAIRFFKAAGYEVEALTGKKDLVTRLASIGAKTVHLADEFKLAERPLEAVQFGGAVDNVGGGVLAGLIPYIQLWGNVACVGLAESAELKTTVMPLILRGVSLLGTSSNNTPWDLRLKIWERLATDLLPSDLNSFVSHTVSLEEVVQESELILARKHHGRTLVKIK